MKRSIGRILIMAINSAGLDQEKREAIKNRVLKLERQNLLLKPDGLKDREMVDRIKGIIQQEVAK